MAGPQFSVYGAVTLEGLMQLARHSVGPHGLLSQVFFLKEESWHAGPEKKEQSSEQVHLGAQCYLQKHNHPYHPTLVCPF